MTVAQQLKMTFGLGGLPLPLWMTMLSAFDTIASDTITILFHTIASELGISHGSVHSILHNDLNMHRVCLHMVPKMLSPEQKEMRVTMSTDLIAMTDADDSFLRKIVTGDETWCFLYDPQTKRQSAEWKSKNSPRKQKFRLDRSRGKVMLEVFFDYSGLIHYEFIPEGRTINKQLYTEILKRLRDAIRQKRPEKWAGNDWFLLHDNAPSHLSLMVKQYLAKNNVTTLEHPLHILPILRHQNFTCFHG